MEDKRLKQRPLAGRQLAVAVMVGGLSCAAAAAGQTDWRWALCTVPVGVLLSVPLLKKAEKGPLFSGAGGGVLAVLYGGWAVVLMVCALSRAAARVQLVSGGQSSSGWILLLLALPLLWMGWGKLEAFLRTAEIFWLAEVAVLALVFLLSVPQIEWRWLWGQMGDWRKSALAMGEILATGVFALPYIYRTDRKPGRLGRGAAWLAALGVTAAVLAGVTAGILSHVVAEQLQEPFFVAAGVLGKSARGEGLLSALWLLPDLIYIGLLSRTWGKNHWPAAAVAASLILAAAGVGNAVPASVRCIGSVILLILTLVIPRGEGKDSG